MTYEKWNNMTAVERNIKVAELDGWRWKTDSSYGWWSPEDRMAAHVLPDYLNDRNAICGAVEKLRGVDGPQWFDYLHHLQDICGSSMNCVQASAEARCLAFCLTMEPEKETP